MRLRSDLFVSALLRRAQAEGAVGTLRRRGAAEAGAIFVKVDRLDGTATLFGPAPQTHQVPPGVARLFTKTHREDWRADADIEERLRREVSFDPDLWIVEIEDRAGRAFIDVAS